MEQTKDYHKQPKITIRVDAGEKEKLEKFSEEHGVSVAWVVKKGLKLFWDAFDKGKIKL